MPARYAASFSLDVGGPTTRNECDVYNVSFNGWLQWIRDCDLLGETAGRRGTSGKGADKAADKAAAATAIAAVHRGNAARREVPGLVMKRPRMRRPPAREPSSRMHRQKAGDHGAAELIWAIVNSPEPLRAAEASAHAPSTPLVLSAENKSRLANRQEWLQGIVRVALRSFPELPAHQAVLRLCEPWRAKLPPAALQDSNRFRRQSCYHALTDAVLRKHEPTLRAIFNLCD